LLEVSLKKGDVITDRGNWVNSREELRRWREEGGFETLLEKGKISYS